MPDEKQSCLKAILDELVMTGVKVSAREVVRHPKSPFKNASDITRNSSRASLLKDAKDRQGVLLGMLEKANKQSKTRLIERISQLANENEQLRKDRELLIASHKALLLSIGQLGGMSAWKAYFDKWSSAVSHLEVIGAIHDEKRLEKAKL